MARVSRDLNAGACLLGIAAVATWQGSGLELGTLRQMGPGMVPRVLAVLVGVCGGVLGARALIAPPPPPPETAPPALRVWRALRAPLYLVLAAVVFGVSVRPLGLVVAAPLSILVSTLASPETR